ncbi:hypothetical protein [Kluyvera sp. CHPC 1.2972]|uniref:hypothetical protein n=1 Tax=Kluyvera sp. CHPC 1.2972 TaxID=2995176 RepID=UPI002FD7EE23
MIKDDILDYLKSHELVTIKDMIAMYGHERKSVESAAKYATVKGLIHRVAPGTFAIGNGTGAPPSGVPTIFDQCRQNWSGYNIHKIFGATSRSVAEQVAVENARLPFEPF